MNTKSTSTFKGEVYDHDGGYTPALLGQYCAKNYDDVAKRMFQEINPDADAPYIVGESAEFASVYLTVTDGVYVEHFKITETY